MISLPRRAGVATRKKRVGTVKTPSVRLARRRAVAAHTQVPGNRVLQRVNEAPRGTIPAAWAGATRFCYAVLHAISYG
ncbi:hypothetical protein C9419_18205 [Paraburkholderia fungorum]|nr:hypothetical protein C9419_18205 [Paraburkholderia fungorum]